MLLWNHVELKDEGEVLLEVGDEVRESLINQLDTAELIAITENLHIDEQ